MRDATPTPPPRARRRPLDPAPAPAPATPVARPAEMEDEKRYILDLITGIVRHCPRRLATSDDERRAQTMMEAEFRKLGLATEWHGFQFNESLYQNLMLHFGLGTLGSAVAWASPLAAFVLHSTAAVSYWADSTRRFYFLRRFFPFKPSQNLLAVMPARTDRPRLRIVLAAHADAAFTGLLFDPRVVKAMTGGKLPKKLDFLRRSLFLATATQGIQAGIDLLRVVFGPLTLPLRPVEAVLSLPALLTFLVNLDVVLRNELVPGANDDLSGVAALPVLAARLAADAPDDVEFVFAVTGCEEASLGGGDALAKQMDGVWDRRNTVVIGLDGMTNGDLKWFDPEGEIVRTHAPRWLAECCRDVAASEPRFRHVEPFAIPVGGSDIAAFLARGWDGVCLGCVDLSIGMPRHYHSPADTPENLEMDPLMAHVDFTEKLVRRVVERHRRGGGRPA